MTSLPQRTTALLNEELPTDVIGAAHWWFAWGLNVAPVSQTTKYTRLRWAEWLPTLANGGHDAINNTLRPDDWLCAILDDSVLVLDADTPESETALHEIEAAHDITPNLVVRTKKGVHHYFRRAKGTYAMTQGYSSEKHPERIDVKTARGADLGRSVIVLPPTPGKVIELNEADTVDDLVEIDQAFIDAVFAHNGKKPPRKPEARIVDEIRRTCGTTEAAEILSHIPPDCDYSDWLTVLMGTHDKFEGGVEGFLLLDQWSAAASNYCGAEELEYKYATFKTGGGITWNTVCDLARQHGADLSAIAASHCTARPVNPFADYSAPTFPVEVLPEVVRVYAEECAKQSGMDVGAYAFCLLIQAANSADHRTRLEITKGFAVSPNLFGGLVSASGEGKSPILKAASRFSAKIDEERVRRSQQAKAKWRELCKQIKGEDQQPPEPPWRQRKASDATVEALAQLASTNPSGIYMVWDEISELIGRMDAYSKDAGKDRGRYIVGYDCGQLVINRATKDPMVVDNFSLGILAGMQPEVLADYLKKATASDGLYQRFLVYTAAPAGEVDYFASRETFTDVNVGHVFDVLENTQGKPPVVRLNDEGRELLQNYQNQMRVIAAGTAAPRFAEHLGKFPGLAGRITLALHLIHAAAAGQTPESVIPTATVNDALNVMRCLYRHSECVYSVLDGVNSSVAKLVRSAAEAVLTKGWHQFGRGDLTRDATHWQAADKQQADSAIDLLIELNWLTDITVTSAAAKGRRPRGKYAVNNQVHRLFKPQAEAITEMRARRYQAIQNAAAKRPN